MRFWIRVCFTRSMLLRLSETEREIIWGVGEYSGIQSGNRKHNQVVLASFESVLTVQGSAVILMIVDCIFAVPRT